MGDCYAALGPPFFPQDSMAQNHTPTDRQTDGHGNSVNESAQWGRFIEKLSDNLKKVLGGLGQVLDGIRKVWDVVGTMCQIGLERRNMPYFNKLDWEVWRNLLVGNNTTPSRSTCARLQYLHLCQSYLYTTQSMDYSCKIDK